MDAVVNDASCQRISTVKRWHMRIFLTCGHNSCCGVCSEDSHIPALCSRYALAGCVHVHVRARYCVPPLSAQPVNIVVLSQAKGLE
jgi:hypothetical protein